MDIRPIRTEQDFQATMRTVESLWDAKPGTADGDRLEVVLALVEAYEARHHALPPADPIDAILFMMEQRGLTRRDLEPLIGSRGRVAEILNRQRPLTLAMIRRLATALQIPVEILVREYPVHRAA